MSLLLINSQLQLIGCCHAGDCLRKLSVLGPYDPWTRWWQPWGRWASEKNDQKELVLTLQQRPRRHSEPVPQPGRLVCTHIWPLSSSSPDIEFLLAHDLPLEHLRWDLSVSLKVGCSQQDVSKSHVCHFRVWTLKHGNGFLLSLSLLSLRARYRLCS